MKSSGIGGQAVIEGVMMKNKDRYAVAVRKPDGAIEIKNETYKAFSEKHRFARLPIIRGIVAFVESMAIGMKTLTYSASFYEEQEQPNKLEKTFSRVFKEKVESIIMIFTVCLSIIMAIGLFMLLPFFIAEFFQKMIENTMVLALLEGVLRVGIFVLYVVAVSQLKDIRRVFMYHGAEHKTINCIETGRELTIENVKRCSKHHKRCGTSFMFLVMFISIIFFLFIRVQDIWLRMGVRILLIPIIAGISYEFIRLAGKSDNILINILSKPGMWLQALTTREPDESMIEVAIASVEAVFDWREYQRKEFGKKARKETEIEDIEIEELLERIELEKETKQKEEQEKLEEEKVKKQQIEIQNLQKDQENIGFRPVKTVPKRNTMKVLSFREEDLGDEDLEEILRRREERLAEMEQRPIKAVKKVVHLEEARKARKERELYLASKEREIIKVGMPDIDEEEDDILKALDRFFVIKEDGEDNE